ncbi:DUF3793 family protein [Clostridium sp.]|uniref:DUF3793 family protein n=1 Tax=Clostridium sp. TaxID=1506 RepID=UPI002FCAC6FC
MKSVLKSFRKAINTLNEKDYMYSVIAYNIAPTLKGLKAASTVTFCNYDRNMNNNWSTYKNEILNKLNIKAFELKETEKYVTVLFYDENLLNNRLKEMETSDFLCEYGYDPNLNIKANLEILKTRYELYKCPHELGVFLGFPIEDVKTFINTPNKQYLLCGYWKVYHNRDLALKIFENFDNAKLEVIMNTLKVI